MNQKLKRELEKLDRETAMIDNWRYRPVGTNDWIIDNYYLESPEDQWISRIDNEPTEESDEHPELFDAIEKLTENKKKVIWNYYFEGRSFGTIGRMMGFSKQRAHQIYKEAIQDLRNILIQEKI
jgi:RNA polymerase sigma factor (sigma-70 family)